MVGAAVHRMIIRLNLADVAISCVVRFIINCLPVPPWSTAWLLLPCLASLADHVYVPVTAPAEVCALSLHDALPISAKLVVYTWVNPSFSVTVMLPVGK